MLAPLFSFLYILLLPFLMPYTDHTERTLYLTYQILSASSCLISAIIAFNAYGWRSSVGFAGRAENFVNFILLEINAVTVWPYFNYFYPK
jgi:hypothetical protein